MNYSAPQSVLIPRKSRISARVRWATQTDRNTKQQSHRNSTRLRRCCHTRKISSANSRTFLREAEFLRSGCSIASRYPANGDAPFSASTLRMIVKWLWIAALVIRALIFCYVHIRIPELRCDRTKYKRGFMLQCFVIFVETIGH